jgi:GT2 family glycosyltransferase
VTAHRVGIVVVHWRGMPDLLECLSSLSQLEDVPHQIVLALNTRVDFDEAAARAACPALTIAESASNLGYAGGCNLGARALATSNVDVLAFLNNDVVLAPGTLRAVCDAFDADARVAVAGPVVTYYDEPSRIWSAGGRINRLFGYTRHVGFRSTTMPESGQLVDYVNGCALFVRREAFERCGGWDAEYFHFFDEVDLCERAHRLGYRSYVVPEPLVRHKVSASTGERGSNRFNRRQAYFFSRNRMRFVRKNLTGVSRAASTASQVGLLLPYEAARAVLAGNVAEARGRLEGVIDGLRGRSGHKDVPLDGARPAANALHRA